MSTMLTGESLQRTVYVGNLDENIDPQTLRSIFITFGEIKGVEIPRDFQTDKPKGFGFIEFEEEEDAEAAIDNYDDAEVYGKIIRVKKARPQKVKPGSGKAIWDSENWHQTNAQAQEQKAMQEEH